MKKINLQLGIFLFAMLLINSAFAQEKTTSEKGEKVIMVKKTTDENGKERVETITEKNGKTTVNVTVDGEVVPNEDLNGDELIVFKNGRKTYFLREVEKSVNNIDLAFQEFEIKLNDISIPDVRLGVAEDGEMNDSEGELGVSLREVETEENGKQVKIVDVFEASAAEEAGLQKGDIITAIDGKKVKSLSQLTHLIKANEPGESITIQYLRDGETQETTAILKQSQTKNTLIFGNGDTRIEWDNDGGISWNGDENFKIKFPMFDNKGEMGVTLGETNDEGVSIEDVEAESGAAEAGLQKDDIITEINGKKIKNSAAFVKALEGKKAGEIMDVKYLRNGELNTANIILGSKKMVIKKPKDMDIIWGNKEEKEQSEIYKEVELPKVAAENRLEFSQLDMYPNPNQGAFTLNFEIEAGATTIRIKDVNEKEVYTKEMPDFNGVFSDRIDISEHPSGVYFLTIEQGDKKMIKKVIYN